MSEIQILRDSVGNVIGHAVATESFVKAWLSSKIFFVVPGAVAFGAVLAEVIRFFVK